MKKANDGYEKANMASLTDFKKAGANVTETRLPNGGCPRKGKGKKSKSY